MGCPAGGCTGYEIGTGADGEASIAINIGITPYSVDPGWVPIPEYTSVFEGNGNTVTGLYRTTLNAATLSNIGLFHTIGRTGVVRNLGVNVTRLDARENVGSLAGNNFGLILASYSTGFGNVSSGINADTHNRLGALVGWNRASGRIVASYSDNNVSAGSDQTSNVGGLVGVNHGEIVASYALGQISASNSPTVRYSGFGGLVGRNHGQIRASSEGLARYARQPPATRPRAKRTSRRRLPWRSR